MHAAAAPLAWGYPGPTPLLSRFHASMQQTHPATWVPGSAEATASSHAADALLAPYAIHLCYAGAWFSDWTMLPPSPCMQLQHRTPQEEVIIPTTFGVNLGVSRPCHFTLCFWAHGTQHMVRDPQRPGSLRTPLTYPLCRFMVLYICPYLIKDEMSKQINAEDLICRGSHNLLMPE